MLFWGWTLSICFWIKEDILIATIHVQLLKVFESIEVAVQ